MQPKLRLSASSTRPVARLAPSSSCDSRSTLKPMLMRLETALGCEGLTQKMLLLSKPKPTTARPKTKASETEAQTINFVVGYSGSTSSQGALDIALWMAHQTRLVKPHGVMVHVVYVVDQTRPKTIANADRVLWQARCLASEWRGSLDAHLRVGTVATELSRVAEELQAEVLVVGCQTVNHRLIKQLANQTPCSVLGLPK